MKTFTFRVDDEIAEELRYAAMSKGTSTYNFVAELVTKAVHGQTTEVVDLRAQQRTIKMILQLLIALIAAQSGEEEARKIVQRITEEAGL